MANTVTIRVVAQDQASGPLQAVKGSAAGMTTAFSGALAASAALGVGLGTLTGAVKSAVSAASSLQESQSKVGVVFGESAGQIHAWAETAAQAMGMSRQQALEAAGTLGNFAQSLGLTRDEALTLSPTVVQLAADLASFNNTGAEEALLALRSGLSGEAEPMRRFGVALSATAVEAKAAELGLEKLGGQFTEGAKVQARYALIMDQSKLAQGDFARTSDGLANQQRILSAEISTLAEKFGTALLPVAKDVTAVMVDLVATRGDQWARDFASGVDDLSSAVAGLQHYESFLDKLTFMGRPGGFAKSAADAIGGGVRGIFDIEGSLGMGGIHRNAGDQGLPGTEGDAFGRSGNAADPFLQVLADANRGGMGGGAFVLKRTEEELSKVRLEAGRAQADLWVNQVAPALDKGSTAARAVSEAERVLADARKELQDTLKNMEQTFRDEQIAAYFEGGAAKLALVKGEQEGMRDSITQIATDLQKVFGIALPEALEKAMEHVLVTAEKLKEKTLDAAREAGAQFSGVTSFSDPEKFAADFAAVFGASPGQSGIPTFASGGIVPGTGPQLAVVHGGERVIPNGGGGNSITINFNGVVTDPVAVGHEIARMLNRAAGSSGPVLSAQVVG